MNVRALIEEISDEGGVAIAGSLDQVVVQEELFEYRIHGVVGGWLPDFRFVFQSRASQCFPSACPRCRPAKPPRSRRPHGWRRARAGPCGRWRERIAVIGVAKITAMHRSRQHLHTVLRTTLTKIGRASPFVIH
jgi:hypothetical protein